MENIDKFNEIWKISGIHTEILLELISADLKLATKVYISRLLAEDQHRQICELSKK